MEQEVKWGTKCPAVNLAAEVVTVENQRLCVKWTAASVGQLTL